MARVVLENLRIDFPIYGTQHRSLRQTIYERATGGVVRREGKHNERVVVRALSDVSMELNDGDRIGLIGHNGSGKSTLLKAIAGIYEPVAGKLIVDGRVTPLFEMMPGLDLEATGYENLFTAGMLLGMSRDFVEAKIPEIEEFCELGEYLSLPVRTYSAGMTTRLGFALVTAASPDVLLMDEGFGFADLRFSDRAADRMEKFIGRSRVLVLATHSDEMIKSICNKGALLEEGHLISVGPVEEILELYHERVHGKERDEGREETKGTKEAEPEEKREVERPVAFSVEFIREVGLENRKRRGTQAARIVRVVATNSHGQISWEFAPGDTLRFVCDYEVYQQLPNLTFLMILYLAENEETGQAYQPVSDFRQVLCETPVMPCQGGRVTVTIPNARFMPGRFSIYGWLGQIDHTEAYDVVDDNVGLPEIVIRAGPQHEFIEGVVSMDFVLDHVTNDTLEMGRTAGDRAVDAATAG